MVCIMAWSDNKSISYYNLHDWAFQDIPKERRKDSKRVQADEVRFSQKQHRYD